MGSVGAARGGDAVRMFLIVAVGFVVGMVGMKMALAMIDRVQP